MSRLRALVFNIAFWLDTVVLGILGLPFLLTPRRTAMRFGRFWAQTVLALLKLIVGLDGEIRGRDNIPPGGCLIAMKHQSAWDTLILPPLLGDPAVVIKRELQWVPIYGWYATRAGSIFIDRKGGPGALRGMVAAAKRAVAAGRPVVIFPQGTRTAPGLPVDAAPYQAGVAALTGTWACRWCRPQSIPGFIGGGGRLPSGPAASSSNSSNRSRRACRAARSWPSSKAASKPLQRRWKAKGLARPGKPVLAAGTDDLFQ